MNCSEAEVLIHALIDGELDAGHARDVEAHVAGCADCSKRLAALRTMRQAMAAVDLKEAAPPHLRARIEAALPAPAPRTTASAASAGLGTHLNRRLFVGGFGLGTVLSGAVATALVLGVLRGDDAQKLTLAKSFRRICARCSPAI
jgi:anti-sigma factor RsiW